MAFFLQKPYFEFCQWPLNKGFAPSVIVLYGRPQTLFYAQPHTKGIQIFVIFAH
jgi:hypothetical protein